MRLCLFLMFSPSEKDTIQNGKLVLYGAPWCNPCKQQKVILDNNHIPYEYIDIDARPQEARSANVKSVPTIHIKDDQNNLVHIRTGLLFATDLHKLVK